MQNSLSLVADLYFPVIPHINKNNTQAVVVVVVFFSWPYYLEKWLYRSSNNSFRQYKAHLLTNLESARVPTRQGLSQLMQFGLLPWGSGLAMSVPLKELGKLCILVWFFVLFWFFLWEKYNKRLCEEENQAGVLPELKPSWSFDHNVFRF